MLLIYGSIIILKIKLVIAFKIWIGNSIQSLNFGSLIQSCQIGVLVQSIHSCGTLLRLNISVFSYSLRTLMPFSLPIISDFNYEISLFIYLLKKLYISVKLIFST